MQLLFSGKNFGFWDKLYLCDHKGLCSEGLLILSQEMMTQLSFSLIHPKEKQRRIRNRKHF